MISRRLLARLLIGLLILPIVLLLLLGVGAVLGAMNDAEGAAWMKRLAALAGVAWGVDLVALVAASAAQLWLASQIDEMIENDEQQS
jgi:hypothetical protein